MTGPIRGIDDLGVEELVDQLRRSERGRLLPPKLDDRMWQDIVDEATELIDRYAPQWTDRRPSDIGMTLVELFAWLVESLIYRLNRVPEKQYVAFLNLLGVTRAPRTPARTLLTFVAQAGANPELPAGTPAQTEGTEQDPAVVFETDTPLAVAAVTVDAVVRTEFPPDAAITATKDVSAELGGQRPGGTEVVVGPGRAVQYNLAVRQPPTGARTLDIYVEPVRRLADERAGQAISWVFSTSDLPPKWTALEVLRDGTGGLLRPGVVRLRMPADAAWKEQTTVAWPAQSPALHIDGSPRWLGLRIVNVPPATTDAAHPAPALKLRIVRLVANTTQASAVETVADEVLGTSDGRPHQTFALRRRPLFARPGTDTPYDHLSVAVAGTPWRPVDYLSPGAGNVFTLDPVTGEISFGDHDPASGAGGGTVPPRGQRITAGYRSVSAGGTGNVAAGAVRVLSTTGPARGGLIGVFNPVPAVGGTDEEPVEETKRRAPDVLRRRDRAVTAEDYEFLARQASAEIALARCLEPRKQRADEPGFWQKDDPWTFANLPRAPGMVTVIVVPDKGEDPEPEPSLAMVQEVIRVLEPRRPVTTKLVVTGPRYVPVRVVAKVAIFSKALDDGLVTSAESVLEAVRRSARTFLHPVRGGRGGTGWAIGESVFVTDVYQAIRPPENIAYITSLSLVLQMPRYFTGTADHQRPINDPIGGAGGSQVRIADYELVCNGVHDINRDSSAGAGV